MVSTVVNNSMKVRDARGRELQKPDRASYALVLACSPVMMLQPNSKLSCHLYVVTCPCVEIIE